MADDPLFWAKVEKTATCWLWRGTVKRNGYGNLTRRGHQPSTLHAHRYAYELLVGPIPEGWELDHLCHVRNCVRPDHLEAVPRVGNAQRTSSRPGSSSRFRGVSRVANGWIAQVKVGGRSIRAGGVFQDEEEAARAASELRRIHLPYAREEDVLASLPSV